MGPRTRRGAGATWRRAAIAPRRRVTARDSRRRSVAHGRGHEDVSGTEKPRRTARGFVFRAARARRAPLALSGAALSPPVQGSGRELVLALAPRVVGRAACGASVASGDL